MWFDVGSREQLFYKIFLSVVAGRTERMDRPTAKGRWPQSGDLQSRRPCKRASQTPVYHTIALAAPGTGKNARDTTRRIEEDGDRSFYGGSIGKKKDSP